MSSLQKLLVPKHATLAESLGRERTVREPEAKPLWREEAAGGGSIHQGPTTTRRRTTNYEPGLLLLRQTTLVHRMVCVRTRSCHRVTNHAPAYFVPTSFSSIFRHSKATLMRMTSPLVTAPSTSIPAYRGMLGLWNKLQGREGMVVWL
jgi:hypothetical protein